MKVKELIKILEAIESQKPDSDLRFDVHPDVSYGVIESSAFELVETPTEEGCGWVFELVPKHKFEHYKQIQAFQKGRENPGQLNHQ